MGCGCGQTSNSTKRVVTPVKRTNLRPKTRVVNRNSNGSKSIRRILERY